MGRAEGIRLGRQSESNWWKARAIDCQSAGAFQFLSFHDHFQLCDLYADDRPSLPFLKAESWRKQNYLW